MDNELADSIEIFREIGETYPGMFSIAKKTPTDQILVYVNKHFTAKTYHIQPLFTRVPNDDLKKSVENGIDIVIDLYNFTKEGEVFGNRVCMLHFGDDIAIGLQNTIEKVQYQIARPIPHSIMEPFLFALDNYFSNRPQDMSESFAEKLVAVNANILSMGEDPQA